MDGGGDLNLGGVTSYYHDLVWITAAYQLLRLITRHAWVLLLVVRCCLLPALVRCDNPLKQRVQTTQCRQLMKISKLSKSLVKC